MHFTVLPSSGLFAGAGFAVPGISLVSAPANAVVEENCARSLFSPVSARSGATRFSVRALVGPDETSLAFPNHISVNIPFGNREERFSAVGRTNVGFFLSEKGEAKMTRLIDTPPLCPKVSTTKLRYYPGVLSYDVRLLKLWQTKYGKAKMLDAIRLPPPELYKHVKYILDELEHQVEEK